MRTRGDVPARLMGFLVFILGVGIILEVVWLAYRLWVDPNLGLGPVLSSKDAVLADIGVAFGKLLIRIALLFVGSISGSLIANKGVNLYFTGLQMGRTSAAQVDLDVTQQIPRQHS